VIYKVNILKFTLCWSLAILLLGIIPNHVSGQAAQQPFGKNRLQYKNLEWNYFTTPNIDVYYYQNGEALAKTATTLGEQEFARITDFLGFTPYSKLKFYVYQSTTDLQQSNLGLDDDNAVTGGKTNFSKAIVEVAFTGNMLDLRRDMGLGMARILVHDMVYGTNLKELIRNNYLMRLPDWFIDGAALYTVDGWNADMDDYMRNLVNDKRLKNPANYLGQEALIVGQSMWNYIGVQYGRSSIPNILNLTRIVRNEELGISTTLGVSYGRLINDWSKFYTNATDQANDAYKKPERDKLVTDNRFRNYQYTDLKFSPDGKYLAYARNYRGIYIIKVIEVSSGKTVKKFRGGQRTINQNISQTWPILAWRNNTQLMVTGYKSDMPVVRQLSLKKGEKIDIIRLPSLQQITGLDISADGKQATLSAVKNGQTDIFFLDLYRQKIKRLTDDIYDDQRPVFINSANDMVYVSNRPHDSLKVKGGAYELGANYGIYRLLAGDEYKSVEKIIDPPANNFQPAKLSQDRLVYVSEDGGIANLNLLNLNNRQNSTFTDLGQNVKLFDVNGETQKVAFISLNRRKNQIFLYPLDTTQKLNNLPTYRWNYLYPALAREKLANIQSESKNFPTDSAKLFDSKVNIHDYVFESEKRSFLNAKKNSMTTPSIKPKKDYNQLIATPKGPIEYMRKTALEYVTTSAVVDPIRNWGINVNTAVSDMFNNHRMEGQLQMFADFKSSNLNLKYQYLKKRIDYKAQVERNNYYQYFPEQGRVETIRSMRWAGTASLPISTSQRIEATPFFTNTILGAVIPLNNYEIPTQRNNYLGFRAEYVFDNTLSYGVNLLEGTKVRISFDMFRHTTNSQRSFNNIYMDIRRYQRIHREITLALRGSYGNFFGNMPKNYLLGGMDNWLFNSRNVSVSPDDPFSQVGSATRGLGRADWLFMQFATNMRGFEYNTLYGNKFFIMNAELRVPIVRYLYKGPISSNFVRNLQFNLFTDAGSAWSGGSLLGIENSINTQIIDPTGSPFSATVTNYKSPYLVGYGAGVRSMFLGFYTKVDLAWGIKDGRVLSNRWYITLGYDF